MEKIYCGVRSSAADSVLVCVGTPPQISFLCHGGRPPLGLRVTALHFDPATRAYAEQEVDLSRRRSFPEHPGKPRVLRKRWDIRAYSREFDWGRLTPGALQLAVATLSDFLGDAAVDVAIREHERFARVVVASLPTDNWVLPEREVNLCLSVDFVE